MCLSSIATGAHGDVHEIPHLVWYDRREDRVVEYGSSFGAVRAAGIGQTLQDTLVNMNGQHLGASALTMFEALADAGSPDGRDQLHRVPRPDAASLVASVPSRRPRARSDSSSTTSTARIAPERLFRGAIGRQDRSTPMRRPSAAGSSRATRSTSFLFYLSDYDYASHEHGPDSALSDVAAV